MKRYALVLFFVLAYLFSWLVWLSAIAQNAGLLSFHLPGPFAFIGLSVAAIVAAALAGGMPAIRDLLSRWVRWCVHPVWYLVAISLTALLGMAAILLTLPLRSANPIGKDATLTAALAYFAFQLPLFLVTEETAWRGFALPRLQARYSALTASLILGLLWGFWHTPLFFTQGSFQSTLPFAGFIISAVATAVLHTWIFNHTRGSVLLAALFHAATDTAILYLGVMTSGGILFWSFVALQVVTAALIVGRAGPAHLAPAADPSGTIYRD